MKYIEGGVTAAAGFTAAGAECAIRKPGKKDLCIIKSDVMCSAAGVYTTNKVKGAPIYVTKEHIKDGYAMAIVCNSGNANTCAPNGISVAEKTCELTAQALGIKKEDVLVCSTGVIGEEMRLEPFEKGIPEVAQMLCCDGSDMAASAIMTTDTVPKSAAVEFEIDGKKCVIGGISKGSGMINPNMATMLAFITTDAAVSPEMLKKALSCDVEESFNQICVDGDTSTNDTVLILANGMAGNKVIDCEGEDFDTFRKALNMVSTYLAKKMAGDGEGATKLIECTVTGAKTKDDAKKISKSVISSSLLKAAMFGADANWGRVLCAIGYTEGDFKTDNISVEMKSESGSVVVCEGSMHKAYDEEYATEILKEKEITIRIEMHQGQCEATAWGCDLTYEYVNINGLYSS